MSVETITVYKTSDGSTFEIKKDAEQHQTYTDFIDYVSKGNHLVIHSSEPTHRITIPAKILTDWLIKHRERVVQFLSLY